MNESATSSSSTRSTAHPDYAWKAIPIAFSVLTSILLCYIILALVYYGYKKKQLIGQGGRLWYKKKKNSTIVHSFILLAAILLLFRVSVQLPLIARPHQAFCTFYTRVQIVTYCLSALILYFVLWYRVYTSFYANSLLKKSISKWVQFVNVFTLVVMVILGVADGVIFIIAPVNVATSTGCKSVDSKENNQFKFGILIVIALLFQSLLLYCFIYPLWMQHRKTLNNISDSKSIVALVKRVVIVTVVCTVADIISSALSIPNYPPVFSAAHITTCSNLLILLLGVIFSFVDWQQRLVPWKITYSGNIPHDHQIPKTTSEQQTHKTAIDHT